MRMLIKMEVASDNTVQTAVMTFGEDHTYEGALESGWKKDPDNARLDNRTLKVFKQE